MAAYWDYNSASSTSDGTYYRRTIWRTDSGTSTTGGNYDYTNTATTSSSLYQSGYVYYVTPVVQKFLIAVPEHWGEPEIAGFTRLVNDETKTGFIVEMVINGDIKITDPSVQKCDMDRFALLLKRYANETDRQIIAKFFEMVPIVKPPPVTTGQQKDAV